MFPFIDQTWNPVAGECPYNCYEKPDGKPGCWAKILVDRYHYVKYQGAARLDAEAMRKIPDSGFTFVESMGEISTLGVEDALTLMNEIRRHPSAKYLTLSKNPTWYKTMHEKGVDFPLNVTLGATIETNEKITRSRAPEPYFRLDALLWAKQNLGNPVFISIEPIMEFNRDIFLPMLSYIHPWAVAIGYNNYKNKLPEPRLAKTRELIKALRARGITVYEKTLREAWNLTPNGVI
jgi:protein gp37